MGIALLAALYHRQRTGEGQWIDMSCTEAGAALNGPAVLDATVNRRPLRRPGSPNSNRSASPAMAPHGIYPTTEADRWVAVACRSDDDWAAAAKAIDEPWTTEAAFTTLAGRLAEQDRLDALLAGWTVTRTREQVVAALRPHGVPVAPVAEQAERIDHDRDTADWGLWPTVPHTLHGPVRVDGIPAHLSATDWAAHRAGPLLGEDNDTVLGGLLGLSATEIDQLRADGVI
jgi:crotonobetainyl-CoA:carnitine CoA-transferase CaiB-like acyl-CoA transferase